ncbi:MAG TPA: DUF1801 domain-containing protein [Opitutaceae bacterium]|jgi:uncharacterized protein YdhG (YjbR/CyaY superfamily)
MISKAATVESFLDTVSPEERVVFGKLRKLFKADKRIVESMLYRMPTYMLGETNVGAFNRQKNYLCLYAHPSAVDPYRKELGRLDCGKSCIRFKKPAELPLSVAAKIIKAAVGIAAKSA